MTGNEMATDADVISMAPGLACKAAVLATGWPGIKRRRALEEIAATPVEEKDKEFLLLREKVA